MDFYFNSIIVNALTTQIDTLDGVCSANNFPRLSAPFFVRYSLLVHPLIVTFQGFILFL